MSKLSDERLEELDKEGFIIVPDFITGDQLNTLREAQRRVLPAWIGNKGQSGTGPERKQSVEMLSSRGDGALQEDYG